MMSSSRSSGRRPSDADRILREDDDLAGALAGARVDDGLRRRAGLTRQRREEVLEDGDLPGTRRDFRRRRPRSVITASGFHSGGGRNVRFCRCEAYATHSPRSGCQRRCELGVTGWAFGLGAIRPSGIGAVRVEPQRAAVGLGEVRLVQFTRPRYCLARVRSLRATRPLRPSTPMMFGSTCSAFIRSPQAQTSSTFVIAPSGISRQ